MSAPEQMSLEASVDLLLSEVKMVNAKLDLSERMHRMELAFVEQKGKVEAGLGNLSAYHGRLGRVEAENAMLKESMHEVTGGFKLFKLLGGLVLGVIAVAAFIINDLVGRK